MLALRLALAVVFVISGGAKALTPRSTTDAARGLGVPRRLAPATSVVLPVLEFGAAALLAITALAPAGAALSAAMLAGFTTVVVLNLRKGRRPACACFGAMSGETGISRRTVVRNLVLLTAALALLVVATVRQDNCAVGCYDATGFRWLAVAAVIGLVAAVAAGLALLLTLSRLVGELSRRIRQLEAHPPGEPAVHSIGRLTGSGSSFDTTDLQSVLASGAVVDEHGALHRIADLAAAGPRTVLLFLSSRCAACTEVQQYVDAAPPAAGFRFVGLIDGRGRARPASAATRLPLYLDTADLASAGGIHGFPAALVVDADLRARSALLSGLDDITEYFNAYRGVAEHV